MGANIDVHGIQFILKEKCKKSDFLLQFTQLYYVLCTPSHSQDDRFVGVLVPVTTSNTYIHTYIHTASSKSKKLKYDQTANGFLWQSDKHFWKQDFTKSKNLNIHNITKMQHNRRWKNKSFGTEWHFLALISSKLCQTTVKTLFYIIL